MGSLSEKIMHRTARVGVIGLGYVGLPLALACAKAGFPTMGVEANDQKAQAINAGHSYIEDIRDTDLQPHVQSGNLRATTDYDILRDVDVFLSVSPRLIPFSERLIWRMSPGRRRV
jgi:UDP-N-acetyl-D-glucosamine dehydrogenase